MNSLHRHPRESGDPYDVCYPMDPRFREDDGVESSSGYHSDNSVESFIASYLPTLPIFHKSQLIPLPMSLIVLSSVQ